MGGEAITRDCGHPPAHTSTGSARAAPPVGMASRHRRGLGMTGGWEVGGEASRGYCTCGAHTSTGSARAAPPVGMASRHRRTYSAGPRDDRGVGGGWGRRSRGIAPMRAPPRSYFEPPASADLRQHERPCPARGFRIGVGNDEDYYARGHLEDARLEVAAKPRLAATSKPCRTRIDVAGLPGCSRPWTRPQSATGPYRAPL